MVAEHEHRWIWDDDSDASLSRQCCICGEYDYEP